MMNEIKFREYLIKTGHTEKSIVSRIGKLKKVEEIFQVDVDSIINAKKGWLNC